jgi:uncharacterized protein YneF (UPF0154 family)
MSIGSVEVLLFVMIFVVCMLGPVIGGVYLATRLNHRAAGPPPTPQEHTRRHDWA